LAAILAGSPLLNQGAPRLHRSAGLNGGHEWEGVASEAERYLLSLPLRPGIAPIRSERGTSLRAWSSNRSQSRRASRSCRFTSRNSFVLSKQRAISLRSEMGASRPGTAHDVNAVPDPGANGTGAKANLSKFGFARGFHVGPEAREPRQTIGAPQLNNGPARGHVHRGAGDTAVGQRPNLATVVSRRVELWQSWTMRAARNSSGTVFGQIDFCGSLP